MLVISYFVSNYSIEILNEAQEHVIFIQRMFLPTNGRFSGLQDKDNQSEDSVFLSFLLSALTSSSDIISS